MAQGQIYGSAEVHVNGRFLEEETQVDVQHVANFTPINNRAKGFSGIKPGNKIVNITVTNNVPGEDFEYDPTADMDANNEVPIVVRMAGRTLRTSGYISDASSSDGVEGVANASFSMVCFWAPWE